MRLYLVHARRLLTYSVSGTSPSRGETEITRMAASADDNGASTGGGGGGVAGPAFVS